MITQPGETYLGDGLYAYWDGWQIRLRAPRGTEDHVVYLEPAVLAAMLVWHDRLIQEAREREKALQAAVEAEVRIADQSPKKEDP